MRSLRYVVAALLLVVSVWVVSVWVSVWLAEPAGAVDGWRAPIDGRVTRGFDPPETEYGRGHRGVDLAGRPGQVVRAAGAGVVGYAAVLAGRGVVTVKHAAGLKTTYEPVRAAVRVGQRVTAGDVLGRLTRGHLGCPVAACLHWGLLRGDIYLDPLSVLGPTRVRLLPQARDGPTRRLSAAIAGTLAATPVVAPVPGTGLVGAVGLLLVVAAWAARRPP